MDVMICDDAGFIRAILKNACEKLGHRVIGEASTTQELALALQVQTPHCLFLDIVMPDQDGLSYFRDPFQIAAHAAIDVIFISSLGADYFREKLAKLIGETKYKKEIYFLNKPFEVQDLKEVFSAIEEKRKKAG